MVGAGGGGTMGAAGATAAWEAKTRGNAPAVFWGGRSPPAAGAATKLPSADSGDGNVGESLFAVGTVKGEILREGRVLVGAITWCFKGTILWGAKVTASALSQGEGHDDEDISTPNAQKSPYCFVQVALLAVRKGF